MGFLTVSLLNWMQRGAPRILTLSRVPADLGGAAISLPARVGRTGAVEVVRSPQGRDGQRLG